MQLSRHRTVSKSTTARENLGTVWQLNNGKFDDGVAIIHPVPDAKPNRRGPHIRSLMNMFGINEEDFNKNICKQCGAEHDRSRRYCESCVQKRTAEGLSSKH